MLDRLLNNRKEWNALKEVHESKMAALEEARKAREEEAGKAAAARQGREGSSSSWRALMVRNLADDEIVTSSVCSFPSSSLSFLLSLLSLPPAASAAQSQSKTCAVS